MHANAPMLNDLFEAVPSRETETVVVLQKNPAVTLVATETLTVEGATKAELKVIRNQFGMQVVREGLFGKVLLRIKDEGGTEAVKKVFECSKTIYNRGKVDAAHPNFVRVVDHTVRKPKAPEVAAARGAVVESSQ